MNSTASEPPNPSHDHMIERRADTTSLTQQATDERLMPLLLSPQRYFLNECRIMAVLAEDGPQIRVPRVRMMNVDAGVLMFEWIDGPRLGPEQPTALEPHDLARAIATAQTIGRYWPATPGLCRLPITDHLRRHLDRGTLSAADVITIASALAVRPIKWGFAHGELSARKLIKEPTGGLAVIDWERAGIYPASYDLAHLWHTTGAVPDARQTIETAVPANHRSSFLLSALLTALVHVDSGPGPGSQPANNTGRADADTLIAQLDTVATEGSIRSPQQSDQDLRTRDVDGTGSRTWPSWS